MVLEIGKIIHANRKRMSLTQEQLANRLGVSPGAVSKWENGASLPDIGLLKPLARVFGTSVDRLLSFQSELYENELEEIKLELNKVFLENGYSAGAKKAKKLIHEYPNSVALKSIVAGLIEVHGIRWEENADTVWNGKEKPEIEQRIQYVLSLYQDIIDSENVQYRFPALYAQARINLIIGETEKSKRALWEIPTDNPDPLLLMTALLIVEGDYSKAEDVSKRALLVHLNQAVSALTSLANLCVTDGDTGKQKQFLSAVSMIQNKFGMGIVTASLSLARQYLSEGNKDMAAEWLLTYVSGLEEILTNSKENIFFSGIEEYRKNEEYRANAKQLINELENGNEFASLSETTAYQKVLCILQNNR